MASHASSIRSAARATFSAPRRVPIRWRLAGGSALLTFVILCGFAGAVGTLTTARIHSDFDTQVSSAADRLRDRLIVHTSFSNEVYVESPGLNTFVSGSNAAAKVVDRDGQVIKESDGAPWLGLPTYGDSVELNGYRVENRRVLVTRNFDNQPAGVEPRDARVDGVTRGQHEDRHVALRAQRARDVDAVELRQAEVEDHEVGGERVGVRERRLAVRARAHLVALHAQGALQDLGDLLVVLDDEHADGSGGVGHRARW